MRTYIHAYRPGTLASNNIMPKKKKKVMDQSRDQGPRTRKNPTNLGNQRLVSVVNLEEERPLFERNIALTI